MDNTKKSNSLLLIIIGVMIYGPLLSRFFTENFGVSYSIKVFFDIISIVMSILGIFVLLANKYILKNTIFKIWLFLMLILGIIIVASTLRNGISNFKIYSEGLFPLIRYALAIFTGVIFVQKNQIIKLFNCTEYLLIVNVLVMLIQYVFMGLEQDDIGGTFGNTAGVNAIQNVLCIYVVIYELCMFLNKKSSIKRLIFYIFVTLCIAALAEITVFFGELILLFICFILFSKQIDFIKKIFILFGSILVLFIGIRLYLIIFPNRAFLLSWNNILNYLGVNVAYGNTGVYAISRIHPFYQLKNFFMMNNQTFWLGLNINVTSKSSLFYSLYDFRLHYDWFSSTIVFLEIGFLGVLCFLSTWFLYLIAGILCKYKNVWTYFGIFVSLINLILFFYNDSLTNMYTAYFIGIMSSIYIKDGKCNQDGYR
jgi:hypothetical protein